ncbi:MAG: hypothetical protein JST23_08830 [Bacteroidetes bacterium]|nr:hypothetical protein [Bacteroidota bacterium]
MKNLITWGGVIFLTLFASPINAKNYSQSRTSISNFNNLSDHLISDYDFQNFAVNLYEFYIKFQSLSSKDLLAKYCTQKIDEKDKNILLASFGFYDEISFKEFLIALYTKGVRINEKFPELRDIKTNVHSIQLAAKTVVKSVFKVLNPDKCWDLYFGLLTIWSSYCLTVAPETWSECMANVYAAISSITIGCLIVEDL